MSTKATLSLGPYYFKFLRETGAGRRVGNRIVCTEEEASILRAASGAYQTARRRRLRAEWLESYPGAHLPSAADAVAAGALCNVCHSARPNPGQRYCQGCSDKSRKSLRARYRSAVATGMCVACRTAQAAPGKKMCAPCLKENRERFYGQIRKRKELGLCTRCGRDRDSATSERCWSCRLALQALSLLRRATKAGVESEPVNRRAVFERDGWTCQICGKKTPESRSGTKRANAPELDHRVPIARGGAHIYDNVQCACHACNMAKGARSCVGQLPIWSRPAA